MLQRLHKLLVDSIILKMLRFGAVDQQCSSNKSVVGLANFRKGVSGLLQGLACIHFSTNAMMMVESLTKRRISYFLSSFDQKLSKLATDVRILGFR